MATNKGGRPRKEIDLVLAEKLAYIQCTEAEIAQVLGVSIKTLRKAKGFMPIYKKGIENGKSSLRRLQWEGAKRGNVTMQIWLGKQYLGQRDKQDIDMNARVAGVDLTNISDDELEKALDHFEKIEQRGKGKEDPAPEGETDSAMS